MVDMVNNIYWWVVNQLVTGVYHFWALLHKHFEDYPLVIKHYILDNPPVRWMILAMGISQPPLIFHPATWFANVICRVWAHLEAWMSCQTNGFKVVTGFGPGKSKNTQNQQQLRCPLVRSSFRFRKRQVSSFPGKLLWAPVSTGQPGWASAHFQLLCRPWGRVLPMVRNIDRKPPRWIVQNHQFFLKAICVKK